MNQHQKRDRLPSAALFAQAPERLVGWWEAAYLSDPALRVRFAREAAAALPPSGRGELDKVFAAVN